MITLTPEQIFISFAGLTLILLICITMIIFLSLRIGRLTKGKHLHSLEDIVVELNKEVGDLQKFQDETSAFLKKFQEHVTHNISHVASTNFKAFSGMDSGGNNSFATVFLNEHGTGVLLSGIHTRDKMNVYSKTITGWASERLLTDEENDLLTKTKKSRSM